MDAATPKSTITRHDLFVTDGETKMRWTIADSGVTLSPGGLS